jgi:prepilin-type N-terminal cleavage/methylation domain-containing protein
MVPGRIPVSSQRGFTMAELLVIIAVIGIIAVTAIPLFLSFLEAQQTRGAAQQVATLLNQARQLAIARNQSVCVETAATQLRFCPGGCTAGVCSGAPYTGPGTDANGWMSLPNQAVITAVTQNPTFNPLGTAGTGTITTQNARGSSSLSVVVSSSGRIRIQ